MKEKRNQSWGSALRIGLSRTDITVVRSAGWLWTRNEILAESVIAEEEVAMPDAVAAKLGAVLEQTHCARLPARILLSDSWVRHWMAIPPNNVSSLADCRAAAQSRFHALFGEPMSDWHMAADWDARHPFLASAMPRTLLAALLQVARDHRLLLLEITPQFVVAWNRWRTKLKAGIWFGVLHQKKLTYTVVGSNGPEAVREMTLPDETMCDQQRLPEILMREALRLNVPMPMEIHLCGQLPAQWVMQKTGGLTLVHLDRDRQDRATLSAGAFLALTGIRP